MIKKLFVGFAILFAVVCMLVTVMNRPTHAEPQADNPGILKKLNDILDGQKAIVQDLDSMKEELRIIKIRVTQAQ